MSNVTESQPWARLQFAQHRPAIVLGVVALLLATSFWSALSYWRSPPSAADKVACAPTAREAAAPAPATVNVYNATARAGIAAATARLVRGHGFPVGAVRNDPVGKPVAEPAVVRFGPGGEATAQQVLALVGGAVPVKDARGDDSVDLVLGDGFTALASLPAAAPASSSC